MNLSDYIRSVGPKDFAVQFGVTERAAISWLYKTRRPRQEVAREIVASTPVTWAGINDEEKTQKENGSAHACEPA